MPNVFAVLRLAYECLSSAFLARRAAKQNEISPRMV